MADVDDISAAVYGAIAGIVLRGQGVNPQAVVAALDLVPFDLRMPNCEFTIVLDRDLGKFVAVERQVCVDPAQR